MPSVVSRNYPQRLMSVSSVVSESYFFILPQVRNITENILYQCVVFCWEWKNSVWKYPSAWLYKNKEKLVLFSIHLYWLLLIKQFQALIRSFLNSNGCVCTICNHSNILQNRNFSKSQGSTGTWCCYDGKKKEKRNGFTNKLALSCLTSWRML